MCCTGTQNELSAHFCFVLASFSFPLQSEMEKMKKTQHVQAVYIRKMQALPGKVSMREPSMSLKQLSQTFASTRCRISDRVEKHVDHDVDMAYGDHADAFVSWLNYCELMQTHAYLSL